MGTPGSEQKISMLGLTTDGKHFFAKYSDKTCAKDLSRNEIRVLKSLHGLNIAPEILSSVDTDKFVFFSTSCVEGKNPNDIQLNEKIVDMAIKINQINHQMGTIHIGLSHGDFTPWNLMIDKYGAYHIIDWEMAKDRVLGYDIFTYITHVAALLTPNEPLDKIIEDKRRLINKYFNSFGIDDWSEYLLYYAKDRASYERNKGHNEYASKLETLIK
jgi:tRNA A-37 threonylcarbamoyl transferase component Bud32